MQSVPQVTFKVRERDDSIEGDNPFKWVDKTTANYFAGKKVILFSLPGAFTPTCSTYQLPDFNKLYDEFKSFGIDEIYCMSVNDSFVMNAWAKAQDIGKVNHNLAYHERLLNEYESQTGKCPTCGQDIEVDFTEEKLELHREGIKTAKLNYLEKKADLTEIQHANKIHRAATKGVQDWEQTYRSIDHELPSEAMDGERISEQIQDLRKTIADSRSNLQEVIDENERRERHNTRISIILEQTDGFQRELDASKSSLESSESKLAILETLKKAFSTNGLLAYKIESLVKELEVLTNDYLAEFSDGRFSINFVVENDKLNVEVSDNGNIIDILALSSGELARVNIATLVAIRKLMASISRSQINVLFLDEVNQALDEVGKEKVVEVLLKEENLNTYMVSHGWTHPLLEKIEITKIDNISYLEG